MAGEEQLTEMAGPPLSTLERAAGLFAWGAACGALAQAVERIAMGAPIAAAPLAASAVIWGLASSLLGAGARAFPRATTLLLIGPVAGMVLHFMYVANTRLLTAAHWLAPRSIATDLGALAVVALLARTAQGSGFLAWSLTRSVAFAASLLALAASAAALLPRWPSQEERAGSGGGPDLLLVMIDSARRDHLGLYGYVRPTSPSLDAAATAGRVYQQAFSPSTWTLPSMQEVLAPLAGVAPASLQGRLAAVGYSTAVFSDNGLVGADSPLTKGFDWIESSPIAGVRFLRRAIDGTLLWEWLARYDSLLWDDQRTVDKAIDWARWRRGPFFLYVHLMDSHVPYRGPAIHGQAWRERRVDDPRTGIALSAREAEDVVAFYDGGIRRADRQVGRLLEAMANAGRPYLALVASDHGESLGESGRWMHNFSLAPELLRVPLVVLGDGVVPGRVAAPVGLPSIRRTLLLAAGLACPDCPGTDLRSSSGDDVVEGGFPPDIWYRIAGREKAIVDLRTGKREMFDILDDPEEAHDLASERPARVELLAMGLGTRRSAFVPTPEEIGQLKALGYVGR